MKIVITAPFAPEVVAGLEQEHEVLFRPQSEDEPLREPEELRRFLLEEGAEAFICESDVVNETVLEGLDKLKIICVCRAGLNDIDLPACTAKGIAVTNTPGRNAAAVADLAVAMFISAARYMSAGERALRGGTWDDGLYFRMRGIELSGHTAAFIGFGAVPRQLVKRLAAFEMDFVGYDPYVSAEDMQKFGVEKVGLEDAFRRGDFVSNHLPVTADTRGLIDKKLIGLMKPDAYFVNTARAATVNEDDIIEALREHRIAGGAFDVYSQEPLPLDSPWLALDNAVLLPHLGGASLDVVKNHSKMVAEDIGLFCAGQHPVRLANPAVMK